MEEETTNFNVIPPPMYKSETVASMLLPDQKTTTENNTPREESTLKLPPPGSMEDLKLELNSQEEIIYGPLFGCFPEIPFMVDGQPQERSTSWKQEDNPQPSQSQPFITEEHGLTMYTLEVVLLTLESISALTFTPTLLPGKEIKCNLLSMEEFTTLPT
jgi:hypothetical protein